MTKRTQELHVLAAQLGKKATKRIVFIVFVIENVFQPKLVAHTVAGL